VVGSGSYGYGSIFPAIPAFPAFPAFPAGAKGAFSHEDLRRWWNGEKPMGISTKKS